MASDSTVRLVLNVAAVLSDQASKVASAEEHLIDGECDGDDWNEEDSVQAAGADQIQWQLDAETYSTAFTEAVARRAHILGVSATVDVSTETDRWTWPTGEPSPSESIAHDRWNAGQVAAGAT